jgi:hypothetical protein
MLRLRRAITALTAAALAFSPLAAGAAESLPTVAYAGDSPAANVRHRVLVSEVHLGRLRIGFERTRLSDLRRRFPGLKIRTQGDASTAQAWTCFTVGTGKARFQVWPSSGELLGGDIIDGVTVLAGQPWSLQRCPKVETGAGPAALDAGVWIGSTRAELLKRLGPPSAVAGAAVIYDFETPAPNRSPGGCSVSGRLVFELARGRVAKLATGKHTSC